MPPTLKDSSTLPISTEKAERTSETPAGSTDASGAQPVALEVPVTVNGARAVEGSEKREPFSETTSTVLVLANGAVIRLSSSVAPGQLLFLTNEKTRKEVVCQVVKSKNHRSASGYVELEFTEPVLGFWGMRFPGDRNAAAGVSQAATRKSDPFAAETPKSTEPKATSYADARQPSENVTSNLADAVQEFKTEIKADSRPTSKADFLAPAETSIDGLKLEANRLQEQLSALLFAEQNQAAAKPALPVVPPSKQELGDAPAKILEIANEEPPPAKSPAPAATADLSSAHAAPKEMPPAAKSSFESEEVQIPAWLEPLARNAAVHAPRDEEDANDSIDQLDEWKAPETPDSASAQKSSAATTPKKVTITPRQPSTAAVFGNSLLGEAPAELSKPRGSGKGIGLAIAAGLILAAGGGAWYFRESLGFAAPANDMSHSNSLASSVAAPVPAPVAPVSSSPTPAVAPNTSSANVLNETPAAVSSANQGKVQTAAITERIAKANSGNEVIKAPERSIEVVEPEIKKPSLGNVRLAKPKVGRSANVQPNGVMEPELELSGDSVSTGASSLGANLAESMNQPAAPAAPVTVGGDVKPARMISSVPPVYPPLAKTQHVAGDVRIDALIDANGRVTTMKVVSGPSMLHQAAMDALRQWKYQAAMLDGKPVSMHLTVTIQFRLQ
jgi:TonB family protein